MTRASTDATTATPHQHRSATHSGPDPVNAHVGARLRLRRVLMGLSQAQLADAVGLTYQQVQKYERGINRISASMLHHFAEALTVPVGFFFDDMAAAAPRPFPHNDERAERQIMEMVRHWSAIPDDLRRPVYDLIKAMARGEQAG
ncbi:MAG: helix-turn-helix domain-containing protein [Bacteroidota bacterium]